MRVVGPPLCTISAIAPSRGDGLLTAPSKPVGSAPAGSIVVFTIYGSLFFRDATIWIIGRSALTFGREPSAFHKLVETLFFRRLIVANIFELLL